MRSTWDNDSDDDETPPTPETKTVTKSTANPECGLFHKGEHEQQFAYVTGVACDRHNFVLGFNIAPGNTHDSTMFDELYDDVTASFTQAKAVAVDAGYKTPAIMKKILDGERIPCVPYKRPMTKKGFFKKYEYIYDEYYDCIRCPANQVLKYATTNRDGYREYKSNPAVCRECPERAQCTRSKSCQKVVARHIWEPYMKAAEEYRYTPLYKAIYDLRKETIERVFERCQGETLHALHSTARPAESQDTGGAYFRLHEPQKAGDMETPERLWPSHFLSVFLFLPALFQKSVAAPTFMESEEETGKYRGKQGI